MPSHYRSPWSDSGQAFAGAGNTIQDVVVGLAQQRAQIAHQQAEMQFRQQQAQQQAQEFQQTLAVHQAQQKALERHYEQQAPVLEAQALLHKTKAGGEQQQQDAGLVLQDLIQHITQNPDDPDLGMYKGAAAGRAAMIGATGHPASAVQQSFASQYANDPAMQAILAAGGIGKLQHNIPAGGTAIGPTGAVTATGGYNLNPGQQHYAPQVGMSYDQSQSPIASAPPRLGMSDPAQRDLATANNAVKNALASDEGNKSAGYGDATNLVARATAALLQKYQGTNAPAQTPSSPVANGPTPGAIVKGYRFKGGDPADKNNWEVAQ